MRLKRRSVFSLERLEDRTVPALVVQYTGGSLYLFGTPTGDVSIAGVGGTLLEVKDNGQSLGKYSVTGDLRLQLNSHPGDIDIDLNGQRVGGSVAVNVGNGSTGPLFGDTVNVADGTVGGSVLFQGGTRETYNIGGPAATPVPLMVGGDVVAVGRASPDPGDSLFIGPGSRVGRDVNSTSIDNVNVGVPGLALTTVGRNVTISDPQAGVFLLAGIFADVGGNLSVTGTPFDDLVMLDTGGIAGGGVVRGNVNVNLLGADDVFGGNEFDLGAGVQVFGSVNYRGDVGTDIVSFLGSAGTPVNVGGSFTANLGEGDNLLEGFVDGNVVGGNMSINAANGNNTVDPMTGIIGGTLSFNFGNGSNTVTVSAPPAKIFWRSGNGGSNFTLDTNNGAPAYVQAFFGSGNDTFQFTPTSPATLSGAIYGGAGLDAFVLGPNGTIVPPFILDSFEA